MTVPVPPRLARAYQTLSTSLLFAIAWDNLFYLRTLRAHRELPVLDPYFPTFLASPRVTLFFLAAYLVSNLIVVLAPRRVVLQCNAIVTTMSSLGLLVGQHFFARQTFSITFWAGMWMSWVAFRATDDSVETRRNGASLALATVSLVFFAAFVGKLTRGYWSGLVLGKLFFEHGGPKFTLLAEMAAPLSIDEVARIYSRVAILGEAAIATAVLLPLRVGIYATSILLAAMWLASPWDIINATAPALGLVVAGALLTSAPTDRDQSRCTPPTST